MRLLRDLSLDQYDPFDKETKNTSLYSIKRVNDILYITDWLSAL